MNDKQTREYLELTEKCDRFLGDVLFDEEVRKSLKSGETHMDHEESASAWIPFLYVSTLGSADYLFSCSLHLAHVL